MLHSPARGPGRFPSLPSPNLAVGCFQPRPSKIEKGPGAGSGPLHPPHPIRHMCKISLVNLGIQRPALDQEDERPAGQNNSKGRDVQMCVYVHDVHTCRNYLQHRL